MMKTIQKNVTVNSSIERIFTIIKVLLAVSPFMALGYLTAKGTAGANLQTILSQNPHYIVMFLVAMVNPFIAYLLGFLQQHLNKADYGYAVVNMALMIVAEVMLQNFLYVAALDFLLYKTVKNISDSGERLCRKKPKKSFSERCFRKYRSSNFCWNLYVCDVTIKIIVI